MKLRSKILIAAGSGLLVFAVLVWLLVYIADSNDPVTKTFKKGLPAYASFTRAVSVYQWEQAVAIGQKLNPAATKSQIEDTLRQNFTKAVLADKLQLKPDSDEAADELAYITRGKEGEYKDLLDNYFFGDPSLFIKDVANPSVTDKKLRMHFNETSAAGLSARSRAEDALSAIQAGQISFEEAAKSESDDKYTGQFGGDLGFFEHGQVLPELEKIISISPLGKFVPTPVESRYGYHIVYPVELSYADGKKLWHAKQILFATQGYDEWLKSQLKSVKVVKLIR